ncbi:hypothetical protein A3H10_03115 [Candidatus Uhrbacteria bacterium RIFCSPLOWO2_12_FULL_46_10]|uniref:Uncharacterized protein n=1 Tax=Candidatus Uhrbacteria bacterium RIFCSPLOWO2_01_FULL_47_25 TaxID=1802402 RepID=A0A1F7UZ69_9BACT|nr:MAG: hypothetical protein A2936_05095 [Candidatus Uhrbacteria bacterium RIFCSPLOWO2_01_FULL_47_25]OGL90745.1 MAG: hypothetical protein A3H10_03115 [Candidatus Uhrbacteria bacterium RIFCSPLOWO2_12_FULL_46_10]
MSQPMRVSYNWIRGQLRQGMDNLLAIIPEGDESVIVAEGEDGKLYWPDDSCISLGLLAAFAELVNDQRWKGEDWRDIAMMLRTHGINDVMRAGPKR